MEQQELMSVQEAKEYKNTLLRFVDSYKKKSEKVSDEEWLTERFKAELPEKSDEEVREMSREAIESIQTFDGNMVECEEATKKGRSKEQWLAGKLSEASAGVNVAEYGKFLAGIDKAMEIGNEQMRRTILTNNGNISQCPNLDGYIAEQQLVNSFNAKAALERSPFRAEVKVPGVGETYGKNSFDVVIKNVSDDKIVHQYQMKFGADSQATVRLLKHGNYNNQRFVVPQEQVAEVQEAFPGKTVSAHIGGTDRVRTTSTELTKAEVKELQLEAQEDGVMEQIDWNEFSNKELLLHIGKNAVRVGAHTAVFSAGFELAREAIAGEEIDGEKIVKTAIDSGIDGGVKACASGALKVVSEKGMLKILPPGSSVRTITNIACVAVENAKILWKVAKKELTLSEGFDHMGRATTSMVAGLSVMAKGAAIGATALCWIPIVGPVVGSFVGGTIGYVAGSKVGETIYQKTQTIRETGKQIVQRLGEEVKSLGRKILGGLQKIFA